MYKEKLVLLGINRREDGGKEKNGRQRITITDDSKEERSSEGILGMCVFLFFMQSEDTHSGPKLG